MTLIERCTHHRVTPITSSVLTAIRLRTCISIITDRPISFIGMCAIQTRPVTDIVCTLVGICSTRRIRGLRRMDTQSVGPVTMIIRTLFPVILTILRHRLRRMRTDPAAITRIVRTFQPVIRTGIRRIYRRFALMRHGVTSVFRALIVR